MPKQKYKCTKCGAEVWRASWEIAASGNVFCSKLCACSYNNEHHRTKEKNPNWKGGKVGSKTHTITAYRLYEKKMCFMRIH